MRPDAVLYLVSQPYLSARRFRNLSQGLIAASTLPAAIARMEGTGPGPMEALDELVASGARTILVQPVGLPFSDSLAAWLPGALAHWLARPRAEHVALALAADQVDDATVLQALAGSALAKAPAARPIAPEQAAITNPGWQEPPPFRHHLLVCSGPRCTFRQSGTLRQALDTELRRAGIRDDCLITQTGCLFPCNQGPMLAVYPSGRWYRLENHADVARFATALGANDRLSELLIHEVHHEAH
ncbi:(2Fe-2S) ferredoxin domain-containing protein [Devosia sp. YIM 151766]|uniref:(2Fe-2S) ferredoxin domain-containing protein n=1 Tax=Devosia sp. YIM 151766 TaxID=3017325 RepID=UPI00255CC5FF|nr:(2Fe-2S) ferredoxin domain-containing protein [Devosia sp. YIM 151766]WIY52285.1 (2Fe-2S) ferredoxin domain-containing protein [Devosia sp. YIM 151766]